MGEAREWMYQWSFKPVEGVYMCMWRGEGLVRKQRVCASIASQPAIYHNTYTYTVRIRRDKDTHMRALTLHHVRPAMRAHDPAIVRPLGHLHFTH